MNCRSRFPAYVRWGDVPTGSGTRCQIHRELIVPRRQTPLGPPAQLPPDRYRRTWHPIQLHRSIPPGAPVQSPPTHNRPASSHGYRPPLSASSPPAWLPSDRHAHDTRVQPPPTHNRPASCHGYRPPLSASSHPTWLPSDRHAHDTRVQPPPVRPPPDSSHPGSLGRSHPIGSHRTHVHGSRGSSPRQSDIRPSYICPSGIRSHAWGHPRVIPPDIVRPRVPVRSAAMIYPPMSFAVAFHPPSEPPVRYPPATGT